MDKIWELIMQYVQPELLILAVVMFVLTELVLKKTPVWDVIDKWFPLIELAVMFLLTVLYMILIQATGASAMTFLMAFLQAILLTGLCVLGYEAFTKHVTRE